MIDCFKLRLFHSSAGQIITMVVLAINVHDGSKRCGYYGPRHDIWLQSFHVWEWPTANSLDTSFIVPTYFCRLADIRLTC